MLHARKLLLAFTTIGLTAGLAACSSAEKSESGSVTSTHFKAGQAKIEYDSNQLMMMNAEKVGDLVHKRIKKSQEIQAKQTDDDDAGIQAEPETIDLLRDAMRILLSRPDQDGARANMFATVRRELSDFNELEPVLDSLVGEAVAGIRSSAATTRQQTTYVVILNNLLAELKPEVGANAISRKIIEMIRDAKIQIPEKVRQQQLLRSMSQPISPSEAAAKIVTREKKK
jgi:hypothetical protein